LLAQEFNSLLPADAIPAKTEGYEGFFHLDRMEGSTAEATMEYIIRDHDSAKFEQKKAAMSAAAELIAQRHPTAKIELEMRDSYYNMAQQLTDCMHLVENAKQAALLAGVTPTVEPIRGGTDGARLSYMGLPCPNLGTGGANFHGPYELASAECMDSVVKILRGIVSLYARM
jgi:tripeptide aminopeptidase